MDVQPLLVINEKNEIELSKGISEQIKEFEMQVKAIKEKEEQLKESILDGMRTNNLIKLDTPDISITYVAPTKKETLDTKRLKEEKPDVYLAYIKLSDVKDSIRIKVKEA